MQLSEGIIFHSLTFTARLFSPSGAPRTHHGSQQESGLLLGEHCGVGDGAWVFTPSAFPSLALIPSS